ncbi:MAG: DUF4212 domain-containing protein [Pseudomonadota bacterium]
MDDPSATADPGDFDEGSEDVYTVSAEARGEPAAEPGPAATGETSASENAYWRENIRLLVSLMLIWFACSFGAGILFRDFLDQFSLGGYPLGFWFAQQGSIYVFIALIITYVIRMKAIERKYDLDD